VNTVMNFGFLKNGGNFLSGCSIGSFSGRAQLRKQASNSDITLNEWMTVDNELEGMLKDTVVARFKTLCRHLS
jgi:hypothetical protein